LFSNYRHIALKVFILIWLFSGVILWVIGRPSWHIGASGVIYGMAFFLFCSGLLRKKIPLVATSLVVVFLYGGMVWYMFPLGIDNHISWEGHLSGAVSGSILAFVFRKSGWQPQESDSEEESDNDELEEIAMTTPAIKEAVEFEDTFLQDKIERRAYEQREKAIRDYYSYMNAFKEEGLQQGLEQGLQQGLQQGMQKGLYQQAIQTAKNMLKDKVDIKLISKYTNLSVEEIKKINEE
jgi:hypothetical protein